MTEPLTSVLCTPTPRVLYINLPSSYNYQFVLLNVLLRINSFLFTVWRVCILRPVLIGPDCALLYLYTGQPMKKNDNDWLGGLTFCIGFVEYLVQAKLCVRLSWVSRYSCIRVGMFPTRCFLFSQCFLAKSYCAFCGLSSAKMVRKKCSTIPPPPQKSTFSVLPCLPPEPSSILVRSFHATC
jgi:hypothetical protein